MERLPLVLFTGRVGGSEPERWVGEACRANTLDLIERAASVPRIGPIIVAAPVEGWEELSSLPVEVMPDEPGVRFHFGQRLLEVVARYRFRRFLYMGGGTGVLLTAADLSALAERALALERGVLTNNLYSTDLAAVAPASALETIDLPASDNDLAWRLAGRGLPVEALSPSPATRLDLDTPTDLAIAALHPACGPRLRRLVEGLPLDADLVPRIVTELGSPQGEVLAYGRISSATWARIERLPCQTRVFSEERGMLASGRYERGEVRAWLGTFLEVAGPERFFRSLEGKCTAAVLDTRVLFAHLGLRPAAADRFYSDLLRPASIAEPAVRAFTEAACGAPVPLLLGGQSLVSGGLLALAEMVDAGG
jgi:hypothetical protein